MNLFFQTLKHCLLIRVLLCAVLTPRPYLFAFDSLHNQVKRRNLNVVSSQSAKYLYCCILLLSLAQTCEQAQVGAALWQLNLSQIAINGRLHHLLVH